MVLQLKSSSAVAKIDTKGAELISLQDLFGTEYMWQKDAKYWNRSSPVLFPIVGNLRNDRTIIDGKEYSIPKHGFCRDVEFSIAFQSKTKVTLNYLYNEETLAQYPYKFSLSLTYTLDNGSLSIEYTVFNLDDKPIDYCLGAHPAFNVPLNNKGAFEDYCLEFNKAEPHGCPVYDIKNLQIDVDNRIHVVDENNKIMLNYDLFDEDAIMFDKLNSDIVKLYNIHTGKGIQVNYQGFDFIAFWTPIKMHAPFLCIEPWNGIAACSDEDNQFTSKRGVKHLEVGEQHTYNLIITQV